MSPIFTEGIWYYEVHQGVKTRYRGWRLEDAVAIAARIGQRYVYRLEADGSWLPVSINRELF